MTPIDNAVLSEMLDNALSDIKYLRQEVDALREAKAKAWDRVAELNEELVEAGQALDVLTENADFDGGVIEKQKERIDELEDALQRATERANENADKLTASMEQAQAWADKYNRSEWEVESLRAEVARHKEALRISIRETSDLEDQLALYQDNCECSL